VFLTFQLVEALSGVSRKGLPAMNIGNVSEQSGLPAKTIRYYEDIGLVQPSRRENGYRDFAVQDLHKLAFLGRARSLGFGIEECRTLLSLYEDRERSSADVKAIAQSHLARVDQKIEELQALSATLRDLVARCHGDDGPDCPIMDDLTPSDLAGTRKHRAGTTL
tara:strand:- start:154 stop:645 length:492 start_codon:yes stop_codon:yes gene_type:complete